MDSRSPTSSATAPDDLTRLLAGLSEAERLARFHHQYWVADACAEARQILTDRR